MRSIPITSAGLAIGYFISTLSMTSAQATTDQGCYSSPGDLTNAGSDQYQSLSFCQNICVKQNKPILALTAGSDCYCGDMVPPLNEKVSTSECDTPCFGYGQDTCGGSSAWDVHLTGLSNTFSTSPNSTSNGGSSSSSQAPSSSPAPTSSVVMTPIPPKVVTVGGSTIIQTVAPVPTGKAANGAASSTPTPSNTGTSTGSKVGIAVGVVVGVFALAAIGAATWFFMKRRRENEGNGGHRRVTSSGAFFGATPGSAQTANDSRLDTTMVERRNSQGSIFADNEDYSRRILRVANPGDQ